MKYLQESLREFLYPKGILAINLFKDGIYHYSNVNLKTVRALRRSQ